MVFEMELVLKEQHPEYRPPRPNEQFCYRDGSITFTSPGLIEYSPSGEPPTPDPSGVADWGNVDSLIKTNGDYHVVGDWGSVTVPGGELIVELRPVT